jgi:hypothetical protein
MMDAIKWIFEHGEKITGYSIMIGVSASFMFGQLWSKKAVDSLRADFEKRELKVIADCEYSRSAHERILGELERAITVNKMLATGQK